MQPLSQFAADGNLVQGRISLDHSLVSPANVGTYSIRIPRVPESETENEQWKAIKVVLITCMDKDVARPLYDQVRQGLLDGRQYLDNQIATIAVGGGVVQTVERMGALHQLIEAVYAWLDHDTLNAFVMSGHTGICGAVKAYSHQEVPIWQLVGDQATSEGAIMKSLIADGAQKLIPDHMREKIRVCMAQPLAIASQHELGVEWLVLDTIEPQSIEEMLGL